MIPTPQALAGLADVIRACPCETCALIRSMQAESAPALAAFARQGAEALEKPLSARTQAILAAVERREGETIGLGTYHQLQKDGNDHA